MKPYTKAKCALCGDVVESASRRGIRSCECGEIFANGGPVYQRFGARTSIKNVLVIGPETEE